MSLERQLNVAAVVTITPALRARRAKSSARQAVSSTRAATEASRAPTSMERLSRQVQETNKLISDPLTDWKDVASTIDELATAVESVGSSVSHKDVVRQLLTLSVQPQRHFRRFYTAFFDSVSINMHLGSIRSKLVKDVCEHLLRIVKVTGKEFQDMANALLPQIINTGKNSSGAVRQPGSRLLGTISELVRYDLSLMRKIYVQLVQDKARVLMLEQLGIIFVFWDDREVQPWDGDVLEIMRQGLEDQNDKVRKTAREVLTRFSSRWSERVDELMEMPSNQSKALLISEHRTSPLAQAILKRYPDLASKSDSFSRSRSSFTSSRSSFRKSPRHKREQDIEIHVSATPPRKRREDHNAPIQETTGTEVGIRAATRQSIVAPESTEREMSAVSRRLFRDPDFSDGNDNDHVALGSFDGSQMHGFRSKVTKSETMQPLPPDISDVSRPTPDTPSRAMVGRSSSATNAEEASLRHPGVRKLQESKIPSPLTRSPSLLNKKRLGSPTRSTRSPEILPSLLPRPGSFTLKSRGSSGPSTPIGTVKFDDEMEANPLSASDEYFSKPIPSSVATPTPPPPSTDNVTLRPRRRGYVHQEPEDSLLDSHAPELSSPNLPVPEALSRSRQVETTPESDVYSGRLDRETALPVAGKHYGDPLIEDTDNIGHTAGSSGHVESAYGHRRLDDCHPPSDSSSVEDTHASIGGGDDVFPDDWRLDDGPRHKFDFEDEIGDRLSDDALDQTEFVGGGERNTNEPDKLETEWHENVGSSPEDHFTYRQDYDEATENEKQSVELNLEDAPNDALTGLLNVRDEMTRLRAITKTEGISYDAQFRERELFTPYTFDTIEAHEESQDLSPISRFEESLDQPRDGASFLQRLTDADRLARSPLAPPPGESVREEKEEFIERLSPLKVHHSEESNEEREQSEDSDILNQQAPSTTSTLPVFEQCAAAIDDAQPRKPVEQSSSHAKSSAGQGIVHNQESHTAHHDQAGRFDAAEKLFAAKEVPRVHDYYVDPQLAKREPMRSHLIEQEHYRHLEPSGELYPAPTSMGAMLATALSNAQRYEAAEPDTYGASKEEPNESVTEVGNEEDEGAPQPRLEQVAERSLPQTCQPPASFAETPPHSPQTENDHATNPKPTSERSTLSWFASFAISIVLLLSAIFCVAGFLHAGKKMNESREYHLELKSRIGKFEASIAESHQKMLKLEKNYAIWSEYVRKLTEEEEANALTQLQTIQVEVQKWQKDMEEDLVQFRQALSVDAIEAAFANVLDNNTKEPEQ